MNRTEEIRKGFKELHHSGIATPDGIIAQALGEIAITLAMMYDLMQEEKEGKASIVLTPSELRIEPKEADND